MTRHLFRTLAAASIAAAAACSHPSASVTKPAQLIEQSRLAMGSTLRVSVWSADEPAAQQALEDVFAEFTRLEALMSTWIADSDTSRVNRAAGLAPVAASPEVREALGIARKMSEWTDGKFDVTFGALAGLWRFDHDQDNRIPDTRDVQRRLPLVDYRAIQIDESAGTVSLARSGMSIHFGGIGKGFAIDRAARLLRERGLREFMVQSGGDTYVSGMRDGAPWRVGIQDPRGPANRIFARLDLTNGALSTSGDYERFFTKGGRRYHHILDPDSGEPARGSRSVTIVADVAAVADGLSTGIFILGPDAGMALIERLPRIEGVIVSDRNELLISSGLKDKLAIVAAPTQ